MEKSSLPPTPLSILPSQCCFLFVLLLFSNRQLGVFFFCFFLNKTKLFVKVLRVFVFFKVRSESESCLFSFRHDKAHFLSLFLFISSSSFPLTRVPSTTNLTPLLPVYLSLFVCLFVNTVQTLRPCKLPPTFTACLLLFSHPWPTYNLPALPPLKKKITIFLCPRKKRFLSSFILKSVEFWNKALYLTLRNSSKKKRKWNKTEGSLFFQLGLDFVFVWSLVRKWK